MSKASAQKVNALVGRVVQKTNEQYPEAISDEGKIQLRKLLLSAEITNEEIDDLRKKAAVEGADFRPFVRELVEKLSGDFADDKTADLLNGLDYSGDRLNEPIEEVLGHSPRNPTIAGQETGEGTTEERPETLEDHYARIITLMGKHANSTIDLGELDELQKRIAASGIFMDRQNEEPVRRNSVVQEQSRCLFSALSKTEQAPPKVVIPESKAEDKERVKQQGMGTYQRIARRSLMSHPILRRRSACAG